MIRVVAFVADQSFARCCRREQGRGALDIGDVSARRQEGVRAAFFVDERVDFCRAPAARAADGLILCPPFRAPLAERCVLTAELSIMVSVGGAPHSTSAANIRCHRPRWLRRLYRLKTVVYGPYSPGRARHWQPSRNRWMIPLMTRRSSLRSGPVWTIGRRCGSIAIHCSSLSQKLSAMNQTLVASLNHGARFNSIGYRA
jgi:hypothetical protein